MTGQPHTDQANSVSPAHPDNGETRLPAPAPASVRDLLRTEQIKMRFQEVMQDRAPQFIASLANLVYATPDLHECEPMSVIAAAMVAASLDLPVDKNLGFAYIVPYNDERRRQKVAQFQMGYKGYIQLALRTSQYAALNCTEVYEGEIKAINRFTGAIEFGEKKSDTTVGYLGYLKLVNGFEKMVYMTVEEIRAHGARYSKSYDNKKSLWQTNFHAMALKTIIRKLLMKWGMLSVEMRRAIAAEIPEENGDLSSRPLPADEHAAAKAALFGDDAARDAAETAPAAGPQAAPFASSLEADQWISDQERLVKT